MHFISDEENVQFGPMFESDGEDSDDEDNINQIMFEETVNMMMSLVRQLSVRNKIRLLRVYYGDPDYVVPPGAKFEELENRELFSCIVYDLMFANFGHGSKWRRNGARG